MMGAAQAFYNAFPRGFSCLCGEDDSLIMEKLLEVASARVSDGRRGFKLVYSQGGFLDDGDPVPSEDVFSRYYEDDGSVHFDVLSRGVKMLGKFTEPQMLISPYFDEDDSGAVEEYFKIRPALNIAGDYCYMLSENALLALPQFCETIYNVAGGDPNLEDSCIQVALIESRLIGSYISCDRIPDGMRTKADKLLSVVEDPLMNDWFWTGMRKGVWYDALLLGSCDCGYTSLSVVDLNFKWLPAVVLLKEELLRLNRIFNFYEERSEDEE